MYEAPNDADNYVVEEYAFEAQYFLPAIYKKSFQEMKELETESVLPILEAKQSHYVLPELRDNTDGEMPNRGSNDELKAGSSSEKAHEVEDCNSEWTTTIDLTELETGRSLSNTSIVREL